MKKKKIISVVLGIMIIATAMIMPFHLRQICHKFTGHYDWTMSAWGAVQIYATIYGIIICALTIILVILNVFEKSK